VLKEADTRARALAWSSTGEQLAAASGRFVHVWKYDGTLLYTAEAPTNVLSVAWSPDNKQLVFGAGNGISYLWDLVNKPQQFKLHDGWDVQSVAWRPDGELIASGGRDATIRLFQPDGKSVSVIRCPTGNVESVAWLPGGKSLAALSGGTLQIWDAENASPVTSSVLLPDDRTLTFGPGGEVLQGDLAAAERDLVYLVEQPDGSLELLTPAEFSVRVQSAAKPKSAE
jgi:WD40 repeat protein